MESDSALPQQPARLIHQARHGAIEITVTAAPAFAPPEANHQPPFPAQDQSIRAAPLAAFPRSSDGRCLVLSPQDAAAPILVPLDDSPSPATMIRIELRRKRPDIPPRLAAAATFATLATLGCVIFSLAGLVLWQGLWEGAWRLERAALLALLGVAPGIGARRAAGWKRGTLLAAAGLLGLAAAWVLLG